MDADSPVPVRAIIVEEPVEELLAIVKRTGNSASYGRIEFDDERRGLTGIQG